MPEPGIKIHLASNLLRNPQLFDSLGAAHGGICRDLAIYAAWYNQPVAKLHVPDFCRMMGYERATLLRAATEEQVAEIKLAGWPANLVPDFSNTLGVALVRLVTHNFIFPERAQGSRHQRVQGSKIVDHVDVYKVQKSGTFLEFKLSPEVLEQNRKVFQTINLAEYLSLRTKGGAKRTVGKPDNTARKLFLRLSWKRQLWDYGVNTGSIPKDVDPAKDSYQELVAVAGLQHLGEYSPEKKIATQLRRALERVGALPSIRLKPTVTLNKTTDQYEVRWSKMQLGTAADPVPNRYPCSPAPANWGQAPAPGSPTRTNLAQQRREKGATKPPTSTPATSPAKATQRNSKLLASLEDTTNSLRWLESAQGRAAYADREPAVYEQQVTEARAKLHQIQEELTQPA